MIQKQDLAGDCKIREVWFTAQASKAKEAEALQSFGRWRRWAHLNIKYWKLIQAR